MLKCWLIKADERPPFSELVVLVSKALERRAGYLDFTAIPSASFLSASVRRKGGKKSVVPLSPMSTPTVSPSPTPTSTPLPTPPPSCGSPNNCDHRGYLNPPHTAQQCTYFVHEHNSIYSTVLVFFPVYTSPPLHI